MAHRTRPPTRNEIAEQAIDFIENLGYPLVPWQAELLRNILKHDGPVEVAPQPETPKPGQVKVMRDGVWVWEMPDYKLIQARWEKECLCTMGYSKHCPVHGDQA